MLVLANISAIRHQKNSEKHEISDITNYAFHIIHIHVHTHVLCTGTCIILLEWSTVSFAD